MTRVRDVKLTAPECITAASTLANAGFAAALTVTMGAMGV